MLKLLIFLTLILAARASAQDILSDEYVERKVQEYYENEDWKKLISIGERAIESKVESYILRMGLGTAYYETENYWAAIPHLSKAVSTGFSDGIVLQRLYECYLYTGRTADARNIFYEMSETKRKRLKPLTNDFLESASADFGFSSTNDESKNGTLDIDGDENVFGEQLVNLSQFDFDVKLSQLPLRWLLINYAYSYYKIDREKQLMSNDQRITSGYTQKQSRLYNELRFRVAEGIEIRPSGHYIKIKEDLPLTEHDSLNSSYSFRDTSVQEDDFVISIAGYYWSSRFRAGLEGSFSYLNGQHQTQYGGSLSAFPLNSTKLKVTVTGIVHTQNSVSNFIFTPTARVNFSEEISLEGYATFGKMNNYSEENGFKVYNYPDVITLKYGAMFEYRFPVNLLAYISYEGQSHEKTYEVYRLTGYQGNTPVYSPESSKADYTLSTIRLGLRLDL